MSIVTYLFGAGASANCLPIVSDMRDRIEELQKKIHDIDFRNILKDTSVEPNFPEILSQIKKDLSWLHSSCKTHSSVDTYAKKLFLSAEYEKYTHLKNAISMYLTLEQRFTETDLRYDNFWASILTSITKLPQNIRILSWNYDTQLELSFRNFTRNLTLEHCAQGINLHNLSDKKFELLNSNEFAVFKINGSAKLYSENEHEDFYFSLDMRTSSDTEFYGSLFYRYDLALKHKLHYKCLLSFAWENNFENEKFKQVKESLQGTSVLIVVGYSFPFFNRNIDRVLLKNYMPNLNKVYFQAPDAENLKERFLAIRDDIDLDNLILRKDKSQFAFPNEL